MAENACNFAHEIILESSFTGLRTLCPKELPVKEFWRIDLSRESTCNFARGVLLGFSFAEFCFTEFRLKGLDWSRIWGVKVFGLWI